MKTIVVNLLGAAGSGKSTLASDVYTKLKKLGVNCELVQEVAKKYVYEGNFKHLNNQLSIFNEQYDRQYILRDNVQVIITDSPLLLSIFYNRKGNFNQLPDDLFKELIMFCYSTFDNINYFIKRKHEYKKEGRYQDEKQALEDEVTLYNMLNNLDVDFKLLNSNENCCDIIIDSVLKRLSLTQKNIKNKQEIERKFLVKELPKGFKNCKRHYITQGYLHSDEKEYRIRCIDNLKYILTEKWGKGISRKEEEYEISKKEYLELLEKVEGNVIKKIRILYPLADKMAEIDFFFGNLKGLKTVEVEFDSIEEANAFKVPDWFGEEVTGDDRYKNYNLKNVELTKGDISKNFSLIDIDEFEKDE